MALVSEKNVEMLREVLKFPELLLNGLERARASNLPTIIKEKRKITHVGMGASALVGSYLGTYFKKKDDLPIEVENDLDFSLGTESLFIVYSYSGDTRETVEAAKRILAGDYEVILASSEGQLRSMAEERDLPHIKLPKGFESRSHLPFGVAYLSYVLSQIFKADANVASELENSIDTILAKKEEILSNNAINLKSIAEGLEASFPFAVGDVALSPVLTRFVNQLAENAKHLASSLFLPEGGHNLICPLKCSKMPVSLFFLQRTSLGKFTAKTFERFKEILHSRERFQINIDDTKFSWQSLLYPTFVIDLLSVLVADLKDVNCYDITEIKEMKSI